VSNAGNKRKLGALSFGYFIFVQAKKSNSPTGEKEHHKQHTPIRVGIHAHPTTSIFHLRLSGMQGKEPDQSESV
jgi:hypothetical protein